MTSYRIITSALIVVGCLLACCSPLRAQTDSVRVPQPLLERVESGSKVRVHVGQEKYVGYLGRVTRDSLFVDHMAFDIGSVRRVDVRRRAHHIGSLVGAIAGGAFIALSAAAFIADTDNDVSTGEALPIVIGGAVVGGLAGGLAGVIVGSVIPHWVDITSRSARLPAVAREQR